MPHFEPPLRVLQRLAAAARRWLRAFRERIKARLQMCFLGILRLGQSDLVIAQLERIRPVFSNPGSLPQSHIWSDTGHCSRCRIASECAVNFWIFCAMAGILRLGPLSRDRTSRSDVAIFAGELRIDREPVLIGERFHLLGRFRQQKFRDFQRRFSPRFGIRTGILDDAKQASSA